MVTIAKIKNSFPNWNCCFESIVTPKTAKLQKYWQMSPHTCPIRAKKGLFNIHLGSKGDSVPLVFIGCPNARLIQFTRFGCSVKRTAMWRHWSRLCDNIMGKVSYLNISMYSITHDIKKSFKLKLFRIEFCTKNSADIYVYLPRSGAREHRRLIRLKSYNVQKQEIRFTLGLNAAKNTHYIKKKL